MTRQRVYGIVLFTALLIGAAFYALTISKPEDTYVAAPTPPISRAAEQPKKPEYQVAHPGATPLTDAERDAYGNRADFFAILEPTRRPDVDWRANLSPRMANAEAQWSQGNEELIILDHFAVREGGFYLDVGCGFARKNSTTYKLESDFGWTGIGVDVEENFARDWAHHRPKSTFVSKAVSDEDDSTITLYESQFGRSIVDGVMGDDVIEKSVTTITLNTLLEQHNVEKVDFLSIDIEGAAPAALRGFDIQKYRPDLCCIEAEAKEDVLGYFERNGYEIIERYRAADKVNLYFQPKSAERQ